MAIIQGFSNIDPGSLTFNADDARARANAIETRFAGASRELYAGRYSVLEHTFSRYVVSIPAYGATLTLSGANMNTSSPTINAIVYDDSNGYGLDLRGSVSVVGGSVSTATLNYLRAGDRMLWVEFRGSVTMSSSGSVAGTVTEIALGYGGYTMAVRGSLSYSPLAGPSGVLNEIRFYDSSGNFVTITGLSITYEQIRQLAGADELLVMRTILGGPDTISVDVLHGAELRGFGGDDFVAGGRGPDRIFGGDGNDRLVGGGGNDLLDGGGGADILIGGAGDDTYAVRGPGDAVIESAGEGRDLVKAWVNHALAANVERLALMGTRDLKGTGNGLPNTLIGNPGANRLSGSGGADAIHGKGGMDTLTGGAGADRFYFNTALGAGNVDLITDFTPGTDKICLDDDIFAALGPVGTLASSNFALGGTATTSAHRILYDAASGALYYDPDGSGPAARIRFATLGTATHPAISAADFQIVA